MFRRCKRPTIAEVRVAERDEALCKALYEMAWQKMEQGKDHPRPIPLPRQPLIKGRGDECRLGDGFYKRALRRLLE